ncbi:hypothetical protein Leryth_013167 [Lithospermum erythrorhizon]|nr:hypothetical protein Leryth_013167 [Lithospermum erythrorhizon]
MASEDVNRSESAMNKIVKFAEEAKLAREDIKPTSYAVLSVCKSLFAGGVAGGLSRTAVAPLERLKILLQVQNPHNIKYNGTVQGLKYIMRTEGFRGLFKGNGTNCARIVPNSAVKFFSYEQASNYFGCKYLCARLEKLSCQIPRGILYMYRQQTGNEDAELTPLLRLGAGACAGIIAMSATYPMDMTDKSPYQYRGIFHALSTVFRQEGPRALYRGWLPSVIGVISSSLHIHEVTVKVPYVGLNFSVYESLKDWLVKSKSFGLAEDNELGVVTRLACGAAAQGRWTNGSIPLDVIHETNANGGMERCFFDCHW